MSRDGRVVVPLAPLRGMRPHRFCDSSPSQHASKHAQGDGHSIVRSFEPGEDWFWDYTTEQYYDGPELAAPQNHPLDQPTPGRPAACPPDWQRYLH